MEKMINTVMFNDETVIITENADGKMYLIHSNYIQDILDDWTGDCNFVPANDARVFFASWNGKPISPYEYTDFESLVWYLMQYKDKEDFVWIEGKADIDLGEEIAARFEKAAVDQVDELDFFMDLIDMGITLEDIKEFCPDKYDYSKSFMEEHGLF